MSHDLHVLLAIAVFGAPLTETDIMNPTDLRMCDSEIFAATATPVLLACIVLLCIGFSA